MRTDVLHVGFDNLTMEEAVSEAEKLMETEGFKYIVTPNPEIVWLCRKDRELAEAVKNAAMVIPDGIGIIYGARILGRPLKEKVPGADFAQKLFSKMAKKGQKVYLLGSKPGVAELAGEKILEAHPGIVVCGTADGYFKDDGPVIEKINSAEPDLLLVCLGAPKQELWMKRNGHKLKAKLAIGLGGSLDVYSGLAQRAPEKWQQMNLEWLYRLIKQPSRIGRQLRLPAFVLAVVGQRIKGE